jgi:monoamine oxidase
MRTITKSRPSALIIEKAMRHIRYIQITEALLQYRKRWWEKIFAFCGQGSDEGLISDLPVCYTMLPMTKESSQDCNTDRGTVLATYTF